MAAEYKHFQPRKYEDLDEWKSDLKVKVAACQELEKAGAEGRDELQLLLTEVVWAVLRGGLSAARAAEFFLETPVPHRESLQKLLADVIWAVGFAASDAVAHKDLAQGFKDLCETLEKEAVMPKQLIALSLETESVPPAVCSTLTLKKKQNQAKTKARYTITRYNLLREHSEGYAKLVVLLSRLAGLEFEPEASSEQLEQTKLCLVDDVVKLAGFAHLCPNRILAMALDVFEKRLVEADTCALSQPLLAVLKRFPAKRLTEVVVFQLLAHNPAPPPSSSPSKPVITFPPPSRHSQFLGVATLINAGLVDLHVVWSYLEPSDAVIKQSAADLMTKYDEEVAGLSKVDLGSSSASKDKQTFNKAFQQFNQATYQKFRLVAALISVNCWRAAHKALLNLQQLCKPCLNHHIRSALCDLLKWLISPVLQPALRKLPSQKQPTLADSYRDVRRFEIGVAAAEAEEAVTGAPKSGEVPLALRQAAELDQLLPQIKMVLEHLEYFLHTDLHLLTSLWKVLQTHLRQREKQGSGTTGATTGTAVLEDALVPIVYRNLLPAASLVPHNPYLSDLMWGVMSQLSVFQRFMIYSCWETMYESFLLKLAYEKTKQATKQILKRVVSNAERKDLIAHQSHFHVCKLCHSNPIPTLETMLRDLEIGFNVNMIQPYVECTNRCPEMTADLMGFVLTRVCAKPQTGTRTFLNQAHALLSPWLVNMGEFVGRFYKKHPHTDLVGLLSIITKRMNSEAAESLVKKDGAPPSEYKGEALIRVILENLIEHMGGYSTVADMTTEQLQCLAGGPRLKSESISIGKKEDTVRKDRARTALFNALVNLGLVPVLWFSLSQQRHHFLSEEFSEAHSGGGGLKLLGLLFDGNHECFLKITEFLTQACAKEKYLSLVPSLQQVFTMFEPGLAFLAVRHGLPPYGKDAAPAPAVVTDGATEGTDAVEAPAAEGETMIELERVVRLYLPSKLEEDGLSMLFYTTFWRLSLEDIHTPTEGYDRVAKQLSDSIKKIEADKKIKERERDQMREYKNLKKEGARLQDCLAKLREEQKAQAQSSKGVLARLEREKKHWFLKPSPAATSAFVADMICPRVLTSHADALFCCHFVRLLIKLKTPGFQLLDFFNHWTSCLTQLIRCCSEREAQIFGVFLREMMSYILYLRQDENTYKEEMTDNVCFHRNYYESTMKVEWAAFHEIRKGHSKWEGRIFKVLKQGVDSEDWMEKRNALLLLSQCCEAFPMVEKYAMAMLYNVEKLRDQEESSDLKTLANSLAVKLRGQKERWVDKAPVTTVAKVADTSRREEESSSRRHTTSSGSKNALSGGVASPRDRDRDRGADGKRQAIEDVPSGEKRSRRDGDEAEKRDKEHKDGKDSKELKEPKEKTRDRTEAKAPKTDKEAKDSRVEKESKRPAEKDRQEKQPRTEKDRDREKAADRAKEATSDRKRTSSTATAQASSDRGATSGGHNGDDRAEKRRRTEREGGGSAGDRGTSDRHGSSYGGHQTRNALTAPETSSAYYRGGTTSSSGHDYSRRGTTSSSGAHQGSSYSRDAQSHRGRR